MTKTATFEVLSPAKLMAYLRIGPGELRKALARSEVQPRLVMDGLHYYAVDDADQIAASADVIRSRGEGAKQENPVT